MSRPGRLSCLLPALLLAGCGFFAPNVSIEDVGPDGIYAELNHYALNAGELSAGSRDVLHIYGLTELVEDDPRAALTALHLKVAAEPSPAGFFALAELSFQIGEDDDDPTAFLASAVYAYKYLLGEEVTEDANPYDRRFRWACDLYSSGLRRALTGPDGTAIRLVDGLRRLPVGSIQLAIDRSGFPWTAEEYPELQPADRYHIEGLTLRLRDPGVGVPLIAVPDPARAMTAAVGTRQTQHALTRMPATLLLRVEGGLSDLRGTLELYVSLDARTVSLGGQRVPLESDFSVVIAHGLHKSPMWRFSLRGLFEGDAAVNENRLLFMRTPQKGRIPVVFVHGTASNPAYWAEMFNVLLNDPLLRGRVQFWFFQYASGNPLLYSAMTLRESLKTTLDRIDPEGTDPDLNRMVLVGHSQGGLVNRLMVVDGSMSWLEEILKRPVADFGFDDKALQLLRRAYEFDPVPAVDRVVFIATPQRGSFLAASWFSRMLAKFISLPGQMQGMMTTLFKEQEKLPRELRQRVPTSLDNMNPGNPMLKILSTTPIAEGVSAHSIIAIEDADPRNPQSLAEADDGVVEYVSAHIEPVESELLVPTHHSCQSYPAVIEEVRRILRSHLQAAERPRAQP